MEKKVFVSGCFDLLHSGHVFFLTDAASYGDLYVGIGSDKTISELKGRKPINTEQERKYTITALKMVKDCFISSGSGILDFRSELEQLKPDIFIVYKDGNTPGKAELCEKLGIEYVVLDGLANSISPQKHTSVLRQELNYPYRIDIAGTWIDQPYVSRYSSGMAIVASIEPTIEFFNRSGMATSTRNSAMKLWSGRRFKEEDAKVLFAYDNIPGTTEISGSQDSLGIVLPGINRLFYEKGKYWPSKIENLSDESTLVWLENHLQLIPLWPRKEGFNVLKHCRLNKSNVKALTKSTEGCWEALKRKDLTSFAPYFALSFDAQIEMFPKMMNKKIQKVIDQYKYKTLAWKLSGAGGGGYLIFVTDQEIENGIRIKIRRKDQLCD